jgi:nucleoside-diphosphate-sugar epimerase
MKILVTGGAGYLGSVLAPALIEQGHEVRILDNLMYGGRPLLPLVGHPRVDVAVGDVRDRPAVSRALEGVDAVVHLAAIVGDPACARSPEAARAINLEASLDLVSAAQATGVARFVFASTCSNYGRTADSSTLADEDHELRPLSLYAETKVAVEQQLASLAGTSLTPTILRFATLYGLSPRMRFDLTVNQFVMEMLTHRSVTVYGEQFWRPYVHVRDAARAIALVLGSSPAAVGGAVFNVGATGENYRKLDLVGLIGRRIPDASVQFVSVAEDPRDYKVSFEKIHRAIGFQPLRRVTDGIDEIVWALEHGVVDGRDAATSNVGELTTRREQAGVECVR